MKKIKKLLLAVILFIGMIIFTPNALAEEKNPASINNIDIYYGMNAGTPFTRVTFTLNDEWVVDSSYVEVYDSATPGQNIIDFHDFKIVTVEKPTTKEDYNNGETIDSSKTHTLPKGTKLYYYNERSHFESEDIIIHTNWRTNAPKYYDETITYSVIDGGGQTVKNVVLTDNTEKIIKLETFYDKLAAKYPYVGALKGDETWMEFGYAIDENTTAIIGSIEFGNKSVDELMAEMDSLINKGTTSIPEDGKVDKNSISSLKDKKVAATYENIKDNALLYSWTFDGSKMTDDDANLSVNLEIATVNTPNKDKIDLLVPSSMASLKIDFKHSGALPTGTSVKLNVANVFKNEDNLDLYYYNQEKNTLEKVLENIVVIDGFVSFPLAHCSEYVLVVNNDAKKADNNVQTSSMNVILYTIISVVSASALIYILKNKSKEIA